MKQKTFRLLPLLLVSLFATTILQAQPRSNDRRINASRDYDRRNDDDDDRRNRGNDRYDRRDDRDDRRYDRRDDRYNERYVVKRKLKEPRYNRPNRPSNRHTWVDGSWYWNRGAYQYRNGYWTIARNDYRWQAGRWERSRGGWYWVNGFWAR